MAVSSELRGAGLGTRFLIRLAAALATVFLIGVTTGGVGRASAEPVNCKIGAFINSLSDIDTAAGTFVSDFWLWSVCPNEDAEPLKTMEYVNGIDPKLALDSKIERGKQWWSTLKVGGKFRLDFPLENYPFDHQTLKIDLEEGVVDTRELQYAADSASSRVDPDVKLKNWDVTSFRIVAADETHPTTYGDPSLTGGDSTYAHATIEIGLERRSSLADFTKTTFVVFIAATLSLVSLLIIDGRIGLLGATLFTVVLSFVSLDRVLGPHGSPYLLDKIHFAALAVIMAAGGWGVRSLRAVSLGADKAVIHRQDLRAAYILFGTYVLVNVILVVLAIRG